MSIRARRARCSAPRGSVARCRRREVEEAVPGEDAGERSAARARDLPRRNSRDGGSGRASCVAMSTGAARRPGSEPRSRSPAQRGRTGTPGAEGEEAARPARRGPLERSASKSRAHCVLDSARWCGERTSGGCESLWARRLARTVDTAPRPRRAESRPAGRLRREVEGRRSRGSPAGRRRAERGAQGVLQRRPRRRRPHAGLAPRPRSTAQRRAARREEGACDGSRLRAIAASSPRASSQRAARLAPARRAPRGEQRGKRSCLSACRARGALVSRHMLFE